MTKPVKGKTRTTTVAGDLKEIAERVGRATGGMVGTAASTLRNRGSQIDSAVSQFDRQHTDKSNK